MESCWICKAAFQNRKQLKQHVGKEHSILSVICPMCCHKEVHFKRVSDLKVHFAKSHPAEFKELDEDAFSESNGFYLSVFPKDYAKLITKADRLSPSVVKFRTLMIMWAKRVQGKCSKSREELLEGWEAGEDSYIIPKELINTKPANTSDSEDLVINQISLNTSNPHIDLLEGYNKLRATLTNDLFEDKLAMRAIARRLAILKDAAGHEQFDQSIAEVCPDLKSNVALKLGIHRSLIKEVLIIRVEMGSKKIKLASVASDLSTLPTETATVTTCPSLPAPTSNISTTNTSNSYISSRSITVPKRKEPVISTMNSNMLAPQQPKGNNQSYRATKLLRMGAMPMFPPARREWSADEAVTIIEGDIKFMWPPKNWKLLSPESKLLQFEFNVFGILRQRGITPMSRSFTHDLFNFLVLPGSATPVEKGDNPHNSRLCVYERLRQIATKKESIVDKVEADKWLSMIECGSMLRDMTSDKLLKLCDKVPVPLRI